MPQDPGTRLQWKWVSITLVLYIVFYFIPLSFLPGGILNPSELPHASGALMAIWLFAGIIIIAGVSGLISEGITIKEPAIAAMGVVVLFAIAVQIKFNSAFFLTAKWSLQFLVVLVTVGLMAMGGAWWGELVQKAGKKNQKTKSLEKTITKDAAP